MKGVKYRKHRILERTKIQKNEKVKKVGKVLLIIGIIALVLGTILFLLGFIGFGNTAADSINSIESNSFSSSYIKKDLLIFVLSVIGGFMSTVEFLLMFVGKIMLLISHRRKITAYTVQQTMPIAKEAIEKMAPSAGVAAKEIIKGIKEGLKDDEK